MPTPDKSILTGKSGIEYQFQMILFDSIIGETPGLFCISKYELVKGIPQFTPIYISYTEDMSTCLRNHPLKSCFDQHEGKFMGFLNYSDKEQCLEAAQDIVKNYQLSCGHDLEV